MSEQRSWCCGFISRFWWWFLALLGLPILFLLMTHFRQGVVESDLSARVGEALQSEGMDWVEVDLDKRGRDVLLKGVPPNDEARDKALEIANGVLGVYKADFDAGDTETSTSTETSGVMPTLDAGWQDDKLTLQGTLASQQEIDNVVESGTGSFWR